MKSLAVEKCLRQLAAKHGGLLQPEVVVEEARKPKSPIHSKFNWDDTEAAHQYRLWQARQLISVCVEVIRDDLSESPVFCSLSTDRHDGNGYRIMASVMSDAQTRAQLLKDALAELNTFTQKYKDLRELAAVFAAAKKVRAA